MADPKTMFDKEIQRVDNLVKRLGKIVSTDGYISEDEQAILDNIIENLSQYRLILFDVTDDGRITLEERQQMEEFRNKIIQNAKEIALLDDKYSEEEIDLIMELKDFDKKEFNM